MSSDSVLIIPAAHRKFECRLKEMLHRLSCCPSFRLVFLGQLGALETSSDILSAGSFTGELLLVLVTNDEQGNLKPKSTIAPTFTVIVTTTARCVDHHIDANNVRCVRLSTGDYDYDVETMTGGIHRASSAGRGKRPGRCRISPNRDIQWRICGTCGRKTIERQPPSPLKRTPYWLVTIDPSSRRERGYYLEKEKLQINMSQWSQTHHVIVLMRNLKLT